MNKNLASASASNEAIDPPIPRYCRNQAKGRLCRQCRTTLNEGDGTATELIYSRGCWYDNDMWGKMIADWCCKDTSSKEWDDYEAYGDNDQIKSGKESMRSSYHREKSLSRSYFPFRSALKDLKIRQGRPRPRFRAQFLSINEDVNFLTTANLEVESFGVKWQSSFFCQNWILMKQINGIWCLSTTFNSSLVQWIHSFNIIFWYLALTNISKNLLLPLSPLWWR